MDQEINNREKSLREIVGSKTGFSIPKSYFSEIEYKLYVKAIEDSFSKTEGFDVPENYFKSLEDSILEKVITPKRKVISLNRRLVKWIPVAAASVLLLFSLNFFDFSSDELTEDDFVAWFESDIETITNNDLIVAFEGLNLEENLYVNTINETTLENYLKNQDITIIIEDIN